MIGSETANGTRVDRIPAVARKMEQLVYIASCWHSGSTLLDMILGANEGVTSLGEVGKLSHILRGTWGRVRCSCGPELAQCPFWNRVQDHLRADQDDPALSLAEFNISVLRGPKTMHRIMPSPAEALLLLGNRALWRMGARSFASVSESARAAEQAYLLFDAIAEINGTPTLIDSSKEAAQLKSLYLGNPEGFKVIHLVRDGRAVTLSLMKDQKISLKAAAREWVRFNWNLKMVLASIPRDRILFVRYEDLCRAPSRTIQRVAAFCNIPLTIDPDKITLDKDRYHIVGGNPMRLRWDEIEIKLDEKWKTAFTPEDRGTLDRLTGRMNRRFGYDD